MVQSKATTVEAYLHELEPDRQSVVEAVRRCILENLQDGFVEAMNWGMICYEVPLERFPNTYNKQPLSYCSLAAQKRHYSVYLMCAYTDSVHLKTLQEGYAAAGMKLDMGKCCVRFKNLEGVHLPTVGKVVAGCSVDDYIAIHEAVHGKKE